MSFGPLNPPVCADALDVSKVIAGIQSFGSEVLTNQDAEKPQLADRIQEIKEGALSNNSCH